MSFNKTPNMSISQQHSLDDTTVVRNNQSPDDGSSSSTLADKAPRVMIVGDSMTQGGEGDWTWRYRLWKWAQTEHLHIKFTGPYEGTQESDESLPPQPPTLYKESEPAKPPRSHGEYAKDVEQDFDSHHYSLWGRSCAQAKDEIGEMLSKHPTDILLVMLGFNDIGWFVSDAKGTLESMSTLVHNARKVNPRLQFAIANIPQRTYMDGREDLPKSTDEYNGLLADAITKWTSEESPIYLVRLREEYVAEKGSYDGLHPNALGDFQIARAFSITLINDFNMGQHSLSIPEHPPERSLPVPSNFSIVSSPVGVTATWQKVYGSYGYEFRSSIDDGDFDTGACGGNRWDSHWAHDGQVYRAQVRACYGVARGDWTPILSATARPRLADPPRNLKVKAAENGAVISWEPPTGPNNGHILQYTSFWKDKDGEAIFPSVGAFKASPAHIDELESGHRYDFWMLTWNTAGEGLPGPMKEFTYEA